MNSTDFHTEKNVLYNKKVPEAVIFVPVFLHSHWVLNFEMYCKRKLAEKNLKDQNSD